MIPLPRLFDDNGAEIRRIRPVSLSISEKIEPLSTAHMVVDNEEVIDGRSYVELFTPNGLSAIYRTRIPAKSYGVKNTTINLEHAVCEIGDWIVKRNVPQQKLTLQAALELYWGSGNRLNYLGSKWQLGSCVSGNVIIEDSYPNLLQAIVAAVQQIPTAMLSFDFTTTPWTLNVVNRDTTVTAEGRLSRNITSADITPDDTNLCTRVFLEGLGTGYTVGSMDADAASIAQYGIIEKKLSGDGVQKTYAQDRAQSYLDRYKKPIYGVTINGQDLSAVTGESLDLMRVGKKYRLTIPDENVVVEETINSLSWNNVYDSPEDVTIQLSEDPETIIKYMRSSGSSAVNNNVQTSNVYSGKKASVINHGNKIEILVENSVSGSTTDRTDSLFESDKITLLIKKSGRADTSITLESNKVTIKTGSGTEAITATLDGASGNADIAAKTFTMSVGTNNYNVSPETVTIDGNQYTILKLTARS